MIFNVAQSGTYKANFGISAFGIVDVSKSTIEQIEQYYLLTQELYKHNEALASGYLTQEQFLATQKKAEQAQSDLNAVMKSGNETLFQHFKSLNGGTTTFGTYIKSLVIAQIICL